MRQMIRLRPYLALALALLVAVTSQQLAMARGQPHAAGKVELCTGTGTIVVSVDENGRPVGPAHICPDLALALMTAVALPVDAEQPVIHISDAVFSAGTQVVSGLTHIAAQARGPPLTV